VLLTAAAARAAAAVCAWLMRTAVTSVAGILQIPRSASAWLHQGGGLVVSWSFAVRNVPPMLIFLLF
jgi:hypothetical protein